jgi:hypothetical protein
MTIKLHRPIAIKRFVASLALAVALALIGAEGRALAYVDALGHEHCSVWQVLWSKFNGVYCAYN